MTGRNNTIMKTIFDSAIMKFMRWVLKRNLIHYVNVYKYSTPACGKVRPWCEKITYQKMIGIVSGSVVLLSEDLWVKMSKRLPNVIHVVITAKPTVVNNSGQMADYLILGKDYLDLYFHFPELFGKKIFVMGNEFVLNDSFKYARTFYTLVSHNKNSMDWGAFPYNYIHLNVITLMDKKITIFDNVISNTRHVITMKRIKPLRQMFYRYWTMRSNRIAKKKFDGIVENI